MKKIIMVIMAAMFFLWGCGRKDSAEGKIVYGESGYRTFTDEGVFFTDGNILKYADNKTGKEMILCNRANCSHDTEDCYAWYSYDTFPYLEDGRMTLLTGCGRSTYGEMSIWQADVMGSNRRKLADIGKMQMITGVIMDGSQIIVSYVNTLDEQFEYTGNKHIGVYKYDLQQEKGEEIWKMDAVDAHIGRIDIYEDMIIAAYTYNDLTIGDISEQMPETEEYNQHVRCEIVCIGSDESSVIVTDIKNFDFDVCGDKLLYLSDNGLKTLDLKIHSTELLTEKQLSPVKTAQDDKTLLMMYDKDLENNVYSLYNSHSSEIEELKSVDDFGACLCSESFVYGDYYGSPSGTGYLAYVEASSWLSGNEDMSHMYLDNAGNEKVKVENLTDFDYTKKTGVEVKGDVDDIYEAWEIVYEDLNTVEGLEYGDIHSISAFYSVECQKEIFSFELSTENKVYRYSVNKERLTPFDEKGSLSSKSVFDCTSTQ